MIQVKCEKCSEVFVVEENIFHDPVDGDIEEVGFKCPKCEDKTVAYRTDSEIRTLQAKVRKERERADKRIRGDVPVNKAERQLRKAQRMLKDSMDKLNGRENNAQQ